LLKFPRRNDDNKALPRKVPVTRSDPTPLSLRAALPPHDSGAWRRLCRRGVAMLLALAMLLVPGLAVQAWDANRMLAAAQKLSPNALAGARELQVVLTRGASLDDTSRLQAVNDFFNGHLLFREDMESWGQNDYWASPLESLGKGQGDCEDYAIAKYFSLIAMGMPTDKLRLVYVRAQVGGPNGSLLAHMVLAYYSAPGAEPTILDNLITELRPASRRPDLVPVFSFNSDGLWQGVGQQGAGDPMARLSRWRDVVLKARGEGFQ
jgi:predicted transglutaminase-like cysteine proteinase